ncbi:MAG TPA: thioesterase family protein [Deltaproteobacteria bacterium]|jgi:acyl-CoA thioester hydrolase|nr:thioesterase family protein [Deltaproteobacteria bacterium]HOI07858.1 thioesterase family protein [Deltaproteobacteria bacterium]
MAKKIITDITIRFRDIDSMGHVNNAVFFTYFEEGRKEFLQTLFNIVNPDEYNFILAHVECDYLKPVRISDPISLQLWVGETGQKKFDLEYRIVNRDDQSIVYASGRSVQIFYDYKNNLTIPIPRYFLDRIAEYTEKQTP